MTASDTGQDPAACKVTTYEDAYLAARREHPEWRAGQAAFNVLPEWLQREVGGTPRDPFHWFQGEKLNEFIPWAEKRIATGERVRYWRDTPGVEEYVDVTSYVGGLFDDALTFAIEKAADIIRQDPGPWVKTKDGKTVVHLTEWRASLIEQIRGISHAV